MADTPDDSNNSTPTPLNCFLGAIVAGILAFGLYKMTQSIALSFALKPITSDNSIVVRLSIAIRTLVIGMITMGTGIFGLASFGLAGLGIQLLVKKAPSEAD
jgi:membrane-anchored protein YejM (alkaline phosphatase superfamily)